MNAHKHNYVDEEDFHYSEKKKAAPVATPTDPAEKALKESLLKSNSSADVARKATVKKEEVKTEPAKKAESQKSVESEKTISKSKSEEKPAIKKEEPKKEEPKKEEPKKDDGKREVKTGMIFKTSSQILLILLRVS